MPSVNLIIYDASIPTHTPVGVNSLVSMCKNDRPSVTTTNEVDTGGGVMAYQEVVAAANYQILFTMSYGGLIIWSFTNSTDRDSAWTAIISTYGYDPT